MCEAELLGQKVEVLNGFAFPSSGFTTEDGLPLVRIRDIASGQTEVNFRGKFDPGYLLANGDVLIGMDGDFLVSRWSGGDALLNQRVCKVTSTSSDIDQRFLYWFLQPHIEDIHRKTPQTTVRHLSTKDVRAIPIPAFAATQQSKIAEVLDTLDAAIRGTEAVVAKLKAMKQGLLHDLLTRGIDANGDLRPPHTEAPHLYKETPLGWLPKEWEVVKLGDASESIIDGPFGSNLKTEHYVETPGVRVVRLQNIQAGYFDDTERAFITERHAGKLARNEVVSGDVLIASLGDDGHPVGRACRYPENFPQAINKADCFRFRGRSVCRNGYAMLFLNGDTARRQARGFEQGVTMKRINLGNLRKMLVSLPKPNEQKEIEERAAAIDATYEASLAELEKLRLQKSGLMDDLLTGRVSATPLLEGEAAHGA